jgi:DNA polymerase-3 subunit alpha
MKKYGDTLKYVPLHIHTEYSLLDGMMKIDDLINLCKERGYPACAITDHGNMHGAIEFYTKCIDLGILKESDSV